MLVGNEELTRPWRIIEPRFGRQWKYRNVSQAFETTFL